MTRKQLEFLNQQRQCQLYLSETPLPSDTPLPTDTPTPTPTDAPLTEISENFEQGLSDLWDIESGSPELVGRQLTTANMVYLTIGEESWGNYVIDFATGKIRGSSSGSPANYVAVHVNDDYRVAFQLAGPNNWAYLWVKEDGNWRRLDTSNYHNGFGSMGNSQYKVIADGRNIRFFRGENEIASYFSTESTGKIGIRLTKDSVISWISIKPLD